MANIKTELFIHVDPCLPQCCYYFRVSNCPVRSERKQVDIPWDVNVVTKIKKKFE